VKSYAVHRAVQSAKFGISSAAISDEMLNAEFLDCIASTKGIN